MKDNIHGIQRSPDYRYPLRADWKQNGFENRTDSTLGFVNGTRTFTITPVSGDFTFFVEGIKFVKYTAESIIITNVEGIHLIYYDDGILSESVNPTAAQIDVIIKTKSMVTVFYWDVSAVAQIYFGEKRHSANMSPYTHSYLHFIEGLAYSSGLGLSSMLVDQDGSLNTHAQFAIDLGVVINADIKEDVSAILSTTGLPIYYMLGVSSEWQKETSAGFSVRTFDGTNATRLAYNQYTGGAWQLTETPTTNYVLCHVIATVEKDTPMIAVMGQAIYTTKKDARLGAWTEVISLMTDLPFSEIRVISSVIFQSTTAMANDVKGAVVSTEEGDNYIDWRSHSIDRVEISTTDHGSLTGLGDDDHLQYFLLAGRATGQVAIGGTASGDDITFQTTSNAAKGSYIFTELNTVGGIIQTDGSGVLSTSVTLPDGTLATTQTPLDNSTKLATTAYADLAILAAADIIYELDTSVECIDTGTDGAIVFKADNVEKFRIDKDYIYIKEDIFTDSILSSDTNTFLGIGATSAALSHTAGSEGWHNVSIGYEALRADSTGYRNTTIGYRSLYINTIGAGNTAIGYKSLYTNLSGDSNVSIGYEAGEVSTGSTNIFIGYQAASTLIAGNSNIFIGPLVTPSLTTISNELNIGGVIYANLTSGLVGIGSKPTDTFLLTKAGTTSYSSLQIPHGAAPTAPTNGDIWSTTTSAYIRINGITEDILTRDKIAEGDSSVEVIDTGTDGRVVLTADGVEKFRVDKDYIYLKEDVKSDYSTVASTTNTFLGIGVIGAGNITHAVGGEGWYNTIIGVEASYALTSGHSNVVFGAYALYTTTIGHSNVAIGNNALYANLGGYQNVAIGYDALFRVTSGDNNVAIGYAAGDLITTGSNNIIIGYNVDPSVAGASNELVIGATIYGDLTNDLIGIGSMPTDTFFLTKAGTTAYSSLQIPQGVAPTSPTSGDVWLTTASAFIQISGITHDILKLNDSPSSDHSVSSKGIVSMTVGENVAFGDVLYMKSDGKLWKTDADATTTMPVIAMAIATIAADAAGEVMVGHGFVRDDTWTWTVGGNVYTSLTPGELTQVAPSATGDQVQIVGMATHADRMLFNPNSSIVEIV